MTTFPGSPRLLKGAIVGLDPLNPLTSVIVFQYNPETITRRLEARSSGGGDNSDRSEAFRLTGPPKETITLSGIEIDATDQLEQGNPVALVSGVYSTLAALEMLLYPQSAKVLTNFALAQAGSIEIIPPEAPLTLFVWGLARVLPVRLTGFSITEEAIRRAAQSHPRQGRSDTPGAELRRSETGHARPYPFHGTPDCQGSPGDGECDQQRPQSDGVGESGVRRSTTGDTGAQRCTNLETVQKRTR